MAEKQKFVSGLLYHVVLWLETSVSEAIKINFSLFLTKHYAMKTYRESGCIAPIIL